MPSDDELEEAVAALREELAAEKRRGDSRSGLEMLRDGYAAQPSPEEVRKRRTKSNKRRPKSPGLDGGGQLA